MLVADTTYTLLHAHSENVHAIPLAINLSTISNLW